MKLNQYQTPITDELLASLPDEVRDQLLDFINNVPFIQRLISPNRQYAKDRPRDKDGKIIVDICNPHILEDMDYFREAAIHYQQHGCYTFLRPNGNPNSEYGKWIRRERDRCWEGMVRPSDGEWIPGTMYFYLNYCPIILSVAREGTNQADRMVDFPRVWEGIYLRFHYIHQARNGGYYNNWKGALNGAELASRGKAFAYSQEVETPTGRRVWKDIQIGDTLFAPDGSTTKVIDIPFDEEHDVYKMIFQDGRSVYTTLEHLWKVNKNGENWNKLYTTEEILKSKSPNRFAIEVSEGVEYKYKETPIEPYLLGLMLGDGAFTISKGNQAQFSSREEDVFVYQRVLGRIFKKVGNTKMSWLIDYPKFGEKAKVLGLHDKVSDTKFIPDCYKYNSREVRLELLAGLLDTDGSVHDSGKPEFYTSSKQLADDVCWIARSLGYNATRWTRSPKYTYKGERKEGKLCYIVYIYTNDLLFKLPRKNSLCGKRGPKLDSRVNKTSIKSIEFSHRERCKCVTVDREDGLFLIGDFITTHNSKSYSMASILAHNFVLGENSKAYKDTRSTVTAYQKEYLTKDGTLNKFEAMIDFCAQNTQFPSKRLKNSLDKMNWIMGYTDLETGTKMGTKNEVLGVTSKDNISKLRGKRSVFLGIEEFGSFPNLTDLYTVMRPSVRENSLVFGIMYLQGTAGDKDSDFAGAQEIMYNPNGYDMYALPNVFDKASQGKPYFVFFFPGYMNYAGAYNKDGVSDVTKALVEILLDRYKVKYNSTDPNTIVKTIAEVPITPSEAILKTKHNIFPVTDLLERLGQIDSNPSEFNDVYVGELVLKNGTIELNPTVGTPIREFPHKDNKLDGAVEIFTMPQKIVGEEGVHIIPNGRYIASCDPVDDDSSETTSLQSAFVLDLWTDQIVAEYTGRPQFAEDYYEQLRRLCLFYNARLNYENNKKGIFAYFSKMNSLYLLTDILEYLKDRDMVKGNLYGNKAHPYTQEVWTPDGKKLWGDIQVGDKLFSDSGKSCSVVGIPFDNITDIYEITLKDGRKVKASENHLWRVLDWNGYERIVSTKDMLTSGYYRNKDIYREHKYYIPVNGAVEFPKAELPLDPYFLGLMLGDGCFVNSSRNWAYFTSSPSDLEVYKSILKVPCKTLDDRHHKFNIPGVKTIFEKLGLSDTRSHSKFIPELYKQTSIEDRLELLRGLMDTDGSIGYGGNPEYVTVSKRLSEDIMWIARSLGMNCTLQTHKNSYGKYYKVVLYTTQKVFHLPRKFEKQRVTKTRAFKIAITDIKFVGTEKAKCVTVDAHDQCYLIGDFIVTHNSKGTQATLPINNFARTLIRDWLLKPVAVTTEVDGKQVETKIPNLYRLRQRALIKELAQWNNEGNFDRVSSLGMLMLLREDRMIMYGGDTNRMQTSKAKTLADDPFFSNNYREYRAPDTEELPTYQKTVIG